MFDYHTSNVPVKRLTLVGNVALDIDQIRNVQFNFASANAPARVFWFGSDEPTVIDEESAYALYEHLGGTLEDDETTDEAK